MLEVIDRLIDALSGLPLWGLSGALVIVMALESSLLTGVIVPGDLIVLFAASTVRSPTQFVVLMATVTMGSVAGESIGYLLGRHFGHRLQGTRIGRLIGQERWFRAADYLERRGPRAIFAGRFLAALHAILPIAAGSLRMSYRRFIVACFAGALTWSAIYLTIGTVAGASYRAVAEQLNVASGVVVGGLIGAALFLAVVFARRGMVWFSPSFIDAALALAVAGVVSFGITIAHEPGARSPDALAFALGIVSALVLLGHRRRPVVVLGITVGASLVYYLIGYPAGPIEVPVWVALYSTAASGRLSLALVVGGALSGVGVAYRLLVEEDLVGTEVFSTAALLVTLALLGDALHRRRLNEGRASP